MRKMLQKGGDNSTNIQAQSVQVGLTYTDARALALDVFNDNIQKFTSDALKTASDRAVEFSEAFIKSLFEKEPSIIEKLKDPAVQYALFSAQREYAKSGDKNLEQRLLKLLVDRLNSEEKSLNQIVLDEAITVVPKLTDDQVNLLTFIFAIKHVDYKITYTDDIRAIITTYISRFIPKKMEENSFLSHLQYCGCTLLERTKIGGSYALERYFRDHFSILLSKGFTKQQLDEALDGYEIPNYDSIIGPSRYDPSKLQFNVEGEEFFRQVGHNHIVSNLRDFSIMDSTELLHLLGDIDHSLPDVINYWHRTQLDQMELTPVGFAIAIANFNQVTNFGFEYQSKI